jgi:tetratricopeptide (TPR) repeat protein
LHRDMNDLSDIEDVKTSPLIASLVAVLAAGEREVLTMNRWLAGMKPAYGVSIRGDRHAALFSHHEAGHRARELLRRVEQAPLHRVRDALMRLTKQEDVAVDAWLHLAITNVQLRRYDEALTDVDTALAHRRTAEAHYWRGRILLGLQRAAEAEHELSVAVKQAPEHARAHHYRARAIREMIETDLEKQLQASIQHYVRLGAPLGVDDDQRDL